MFDLQVRDLPRVGMIKESTQLAMQLNLTNTNKTMEKTFSKPSVMTTALAAALAISGPAHGAITWIGPVVVPEPASTALRRRRV